MKLFNIKIIQGDDVDLIFSILDKNENPVDMASASDITFKIKKSICGSVLVLKTLGEGITLSSPTTELTVALSSTDTGDATLAPGKYYFELQIQC